MMVLIQISRGLHRKPLARPLRVVFKAIILHSEAQNYRPYLSPHNLRNFSVSSHKLADFTHAVIGAGVVGLAIARKLQSRHPGVSTILLEQHGAVGTETSSRNSEVIHAGLYYGPESLKTELCVHGKKLLYELCKAYSIPHRQAGKWIVAQNETELEQLENIRKHAKSLDIPTQFVPLEEGKAQEPEIQAMAGILESPSTGIVDSHSLMQFLQGDFEDKGGITVLNTKVIKIVPRNTGSLGWEIWSKASDSTTPISRQNVGGHVEETCIVAETIVNSAGLYAVPISNTILPKKRHIVPYYTRGTYYSYGAAKPRPKRLIYPAPIPGHGGLGAHLTLDLAGRIRFGPDVQRVHSPTDLVPSKGDLQAAIAEIRSYLPNIDPALVSPDYCGIRPKLSKQSAQISGRGFQDFYIRHEEGFSGFVNLMGIESPGLTSSLAIAELVDQLLYR